MLKPAVYAILDPGHTEIKNIEDLSTRVEGTGNPLFFTLKGEYTMYIFQTRFGSGTFDTWRDGVSVGKLIPTVVPFLLFLFHSSSKNAMPTRNGSSHLAVASFAHSSRLIRMKR
jgi:hypothetical protein